MPKFCYWSVATGKHAHMMSALIASARAVGVTEDFHVWSDLPVAGAIMHDSGTFDMRLYLFKFRFLHEQVQKLDYEYFVFLDADCYFVRNPGDVSALANGQKVFVQMENDLTSSAVKRGDWWSAPIPDLIQLMHDAGVPAGSKIYNTNAGFWMVRKDAVNEFYAKAMGFWTEGQNRGYKDFTEEPPLAFVGHTMAKPELATLSKTSHVWASDWTGHYAGRLPDGKPWNFENYMTGEKVEVNPAIVHAMRSKDAMIVAASIKPAVATAPIASSALIDKGFWMGHKMLGDVVGFCAAAYALHLKTGRTIRVFFEENRKNALDLFSGVEWVPHEVIPEAIDCGGSPSVDELNTGGFNGMSRFYRYMDPSASPRFSFTYARQKPETENLIGVICHGNTQGDIDPDTLSAMLAEARTTYPDHRLVLFGCKDNATVPDGVEDWRVDNGNDVAKTIETIGRFRLLITPQSGPAHIAAGWGIPMWAYRGKDPHWDHAIEYPGASIRWWERPKAAAPERKKVQRSISQNEPLYVNWKSGLGDAILHLSLYYHYAKYIGKKLYFYGNHEVIDRKMRELIVLFEKDQPDIHQYLEQVACSEIRVDGGPEDFTGWHPIPSENCHQPVWERFHVGHMLTAFIPIMKFENVWRPADALWFPHGYLHYRSAQPVQRKILIHLAGGTSGNYESNYYINKQELTRLIEELRTAGYEIVFHGPHDDWVRSLTGVRLIEEQTMLATFEEVATSEAIIAVESGPSLAALCCGVPLNLIEIKTRGDLQIGMMDYANIISTRKGTNVVVKSEDRRFLEHGFASGLILKGALARL